MNSKQLNFFITTQDWGEIENFLMNRNCLIVQNNIRNVQDAFERKSILNDKGFQIYLSRLEHKEDVILKHLKSKDYYYVDILKSYTVEFSFGGVYSNRKELRRSRFYYVTKYYDADGNVIEKDSDFIKWADSVFKDFKKTFLQRSGLDTEFLFSDSAIKWYKNNHAELKEDQSVLRWQ